MRWISALFLLAFWLTASPALADAPRPWSAERADVLRDVAAGEPVVSYVVVPLCSNSQIDCGASWAGQPGRLRTNLYWGAIFGARTIFDRKRSGWQRVHVERGGPEMLERITYRRRVPAARWGFEREEPVEQLVVLHAVHGEHIDGAVDLFWKLSRDGGTVRFDDGGRARSASIHTVGYAGHNRLMDGKRLPAQRAASARARSSFVLACYSESYFGGALSRLGAAPLVSTRALMAPEGYVVEAVVKALGDNEPPERVRYRTIAAYAKWQRIPFGRAARVFAGPRISSR